MRRLVLERVRELRSRANTVVRCLPYGRRRLTLVPATAPARVSKPVLWRHALVLVILLTVGGFLSLSYATSGGLLHSASAAEAYGNNPSTPDMIAALISNSHVYLPFVSNPGGPAGAKPTSTPKPSPTNTPKPANTPVPPANDPIVLATGDSRDGCNSGATATANLLSRYPSSTLLLFNGDSTNTGAYSEFTTCFNTTYGQHKAQIRPVPGNHEYDTSGGSGYYSYYGTQAKPQGQSYYSLNLGTWHIVALNSEIDISGTSSEMTWLKNDLAAHPAQCTLAYWHEPRWSSGNHGNNTFVSALWQTLYDNNVDVVFNGHDHDYERFAPQNPSGGADSARGIREFVIGTAGAPPYSFSTIRANSQMRMTGQYGLVQFTLHPSSYDWKWIGATGSFADAGTSACH